MAKVPSHSYFLVVDLGSSRIRCILVDRRGRPAGVASADWRPIAPPDLAPLGREFPPDATWELVCRLARGALRSAGIRGSAVAAVGATSQREGVVFLDAAGEELYAGPNTDLRAFLEGQRIDEAHRAEVYQATGHLPSFLFTAAKLQWFKSNRPESFQRIRHVLSLDAWVAYRLSGEIAVERSAASEMGLLDVATGAWATGLLSRLGLPIDILPPLVEAGQSLGKVKADAAAKTGLSRETLMVAAGPDTQCGLLGMGVTEPGQVGIVAGWSAPVQMVLDRFLLDGSSRTWSGRHVVPGSWVLESGATEAGSAFRWVAGTLTPDGASDLFAFIDRLASKAPPGSEGALAYLGPQAADMANVGPRWGGLLFPLLSYALPLERANLLRAALENLAFAIKSNLLQLQEISGAAPRTVSLGGGMAQSKTLRRILADTLGHEVRLARSHEVTGLGAAMCAATGAGAYRDLREAAQAMVRPAKPVDPNRLATLEYEEHFARWVAMAAGLDALGDRL